MQSSIFLCMSQARINLEGCSSKGIRRKNGGDNRGGLPNSLEGVAPSRTVTVSASVTYFGFVDLEKAFHRVPREVIRWAMRNLGVEEWLVSAVMSMYTGAKTVVRTVYGNSSSSEVNIGMHQGSALSPLLFVIVTEAISTELRVALPWELYMLRLGCDSYDKWRTSEANAEGCKIAMWDM